MALDGAHERDISVILGTPAYAVPPWPARQYPEITGERIIRKVVERYYLPPVHELEAHGSACQAMPSYVTLRRFKPGLGHVHGSGVRVWPGHRGGDVKPWPRTSSREEGASTAVERSPSPYCSCGACRPVAGLDG
ncbi:beta-galactosidase [Nonomuraea polychroma]|uniref:beta-galactosidase n=1 Tax=Nonomuraea polychroma TaxID=46176 RepID=UPI0019D44E8A